jgi:hypothetical protein
LEDDTADEDEAAKEEAAGPAMGAKHSTEHKHNDRQLISRTIASI